MEATNIEKINKLSLDVLNLAINSLLVNMRFLDLSINQLKLTPRYDIDNLMCDGKFFIYNPRYVLLEYKKENNKIIHDYLHVLLHCVFLHMFINPSVDRDLWNLACDIAVENSLIDLNINNLNINTLYLEKSYIDELVNDNVKISAEKIYAYLKNNKFDENKYKELCDLFYVDDHSIWYNNDNINGNISINYIDGKNAITSLNETWKYISSRMQEEIKNFYKDIGKETDCLMQNLKEVNREKYDYASFLKKFASINEVMKVNDDEFDYVYYTYGLSSYKNMPLIEPLEYKDEKVIKEFAIIIDTSGSVEGDLVQTFLNKTYNIIHNAESFANKINLHIIQCDTKIKEDKIITSKEDFDIYIKTMKLKGFGGTDFRPAFDYVNELVSSHQMNNLKGVIYFTDGYGIYPNKKPNYETAFVFIRDEYDDTKVPSWAIKLVLEREDI